MQRLFSFLVNINQEIYFNTGLTVEPNFCHLNNELMSSQ